MPFKKYVFVTISLILFLSSYNSYSQIPTDGLVGYYKLDGDAVDSSPVGNDGNIVDPVTPTTNRFGETDKACHFSGGYIDAGNPVELQITEAISIAAWIKVDSIAFWAGLVTKWRAAGIGGIFLGANPNTGAMRWNLNMTDPVESNVLVIGEWIHILTTFDGDTAKVYQDGELVNMISHSLPIPDNDANLVIGSQSNILTANFDGAIDDVLIYNRALSEDEIKVVFESGGGIRTTQTLTICDGDSIVVGTNTYDTAGTYTDILTAANGSDSTVTTNLIVNTVDVSVFISGLDFTANAANATFQWVDCNDNNASITGETNAMYTATESGSYAVLVTENGCTGMSTCYEVAVSGVSDNLLKGISVYPNPTEGEFIISNDLNLRMSVKLIDLVGTVVYSEIINESSHVLNISSLTSGVYILQMRVGEMQNTVKLIKQ